MSECGYEFTTLPGACGLAEGHDGPHQTFREALALARQTAAEEMTRADEAEEKLSNRPPLEEKHES